MALTDNSDIFGSVHEDGFNRVINHVMRKRPSLFNYGTQWVADNWKERLCKTPEVAPEVIRHGNPVLTIEEPIPILGSGGFYGLNFAVQLVEFEIDFHPGKFELPKELGGKLPEQSIAFKITACAGLGCPSKEILDKFPPAPQPPIVLIDDQRKDPTGETPKRPRDPIALPPDRLTCFCLDLYTVLHAEITGPVGGETLEFKLDGLEIVDIRPEEMEFNIECYMKMLMHYVLLPRLRILLPVLVLDLPENLGTVTVKASTSVPHNPAIQNDQVEVFVDMEVAS